jgi:hypothetical protein
VIERRSIGHGADMNARHLFGVILALSFATALQGCLWEVPIGQDDRDGGRSGIDASPLDAGRTTRDSGPGDSAVLADAALIDAALVADSGSPAGDAEVDGASDSGSDGGPSCDVAFEFHDETRLVLDTTGIPPSDPDPCAHGHRILLGRFVVTERSELMVMVTGGAVFSLGIARDCTGPAFYCEPLEEIGAVMVFPVDPGTYYLVVGREDEGEMELLARITPV